MKNKFINDFDIFKSTNESMLDRFKDPEITISDKARHNLKGAGEVLSSLLDVFKSDQYSALIEPIEEMQENELINKQKEWQVDFLAMQKTLYMIYGILYKGYSSAANAIKDEIDDIDNIILLNGEPLNNVRILDRNLHKSIKMYDPEIKRFTTNIEKVWMFIKQTFPQEIKNAITIFEEFGIDVYDEKRHQLKPPKIVKKYNNFKMSGKGNLQLNYHKILDAMNQIKDNGAWSSKKKGNIVDIYTTYLETQGDIEDVIPYDITPTGLK